MMQRNRIPEKNIGNSRNHETTKLRKRRNKKSMPAIVYDSRPLAAQLTQELQREATHFLETYSRRARLAQLIVGHDNAAELYRRQLERTSRTVGIECTTYTYPFETTEEELRAEVAALNENADVDGVVLLLPLPNHIRQRMVTDVLRPEKDVDGLGANNAGNMMLGFPNYIPSTADVVLAVLHDTNLSVAGKNTVIVGRSNVGGKPIALMLMRDDATVTLCHSHTQDLTEITRDADILVASVGRPMMITAAMVKPGAIVLDAGINEIDGAVVGDVDFSSVKEVASFITPVPGGLGPLTHLMLIRHTLLGPR